MKKYCLTKCAKRKLTKLQKGTISLLIFVAALLAFVAFFMMILAIIGLATNLIISLEWIPEPAIPVENIFESGVVGVGGIVGFSIVAYLIFISFKVIYSITIEIARFAKDRYEGRYEKCNLFEECEDDEIEDSGD